MIISCLLQCPKGKKTEAGESETSRAWIADAVMIVTPWRSFKPTWGPTTCGRCRPPWPRSAWGWSETLTPARGSGPRGRSRPAHLDTRRPLWSVTAFVLKKHFRGPFLPTAITLYNSSLPCDRWFPGLLSGPSGKYCTDALRNLVYPFLPFPTSALPCLLYIDWLKIAVIVYLLDCF